MIVLRYKKVFIIVFSGVLNMSNGKYVVWGWDGVIVPRELGRDAHVKWFNFMAKELDDKGILQHIGSEDYYKHVKGITARFLGVRTWENKVLLNTVARNLYAGFILSESRGKQRIWHGVREAMGRTDEMGYVNFIVSGTPREVVKAVARQGSLAVKLGDISASKIFQGPKSKADLLAHLPAGDFEVALYVGEGAKDLSVARNLGFNRVVATWDKTPDYAGKYDTEGAAQAITYANDNAASSPSEIFGFLGS